MSYFSALEIFTLFVSVSVKYQFKTGGQVDPSIAPTSVGATMVADTDKSTMKFRSIGTMTGEDDDKGQDKGIGDGKGIGKVNGKGLVSKEDAAQPQIEDMFAMCSSQASVGSVGAVSFDLDLLVESPLELLGTSKNGKLGLI